MMWHHAAFLPHLRERDVTGPVRAVRRGDPAPAASRAPSRAPGRSIQMYLTMVGGGVP
jgi:hypothetical protein